MVIPCKTRAASEDPTRARYPEHAYVDIAIHSFAVTQLYINVKYVYRRIDCRPRRAYSCRRPEHGSEHDIVSYSIDLISGYL